MRYHLTLVRMAIIKKSTNNKCRQGYGEKGTVVHCWWECKLVQPLWKSVWRFLKKLKTELPYDPAIPLLGLYLKKTKTLIRKDTCTQCSPQHYLQLPRYGSNYLSIYICISISISVYTHTHTHTHTKEYYSAIKKNEILPFAATWMDLEIIILNEVSRTEKDKYMILLIRGI